MAKTPRPFPPNVVALHADQASGIRRETLAVLEPSPVPPAPTFPIHVFPPPIADFISAVATSIPVPVDLVGLPVLVVLGAAIGTSRSVSPKEGWTEYPCLYGGIVAPSGVGKSPAIQAALQPVYTHQQALVERWKHEKIQYAAKVGHSNEGAPPCLSHILTTDATVEAVGAMLATSPRGLLLHRDELTGWLGSMDQYRNGRGADREFWLTVHSGTAQKIDRKGGRDPLFLPRPLVCILGGFVPKNSDRFWTGEGREPDGFYQRILFVFPEAVPLAVSRAGVPLGVRRGYADVVHRLFQLGPPDNSSPSADPPPLQFAPDALDQWWQWNQAVHEQMRDLPDTLGAKWQKFVGMSLRFVIILHEVWAGGSSGTTVEVATIDRSRELVEYFMAHERRIHDCVQMDAAERRDRAVYAWLLKRPNPETSARDVQRHGVAGIAKASEAKAVLRSLVDRSWACWRVENQSVWIPSPDTPDNPTRGS